MEPDPGQPAAAHSPSDVTVMLAAAAAGDASAARDLFPLVYEELRRLARARMRGVPEGNTLQPTALVHEAFLKMVEGGRGSAWESRGHFFAAAARAMRNILVDQARAKGAEKRGGGRRRVASDSSAFLIDSPVDDMLAFDDALKKLEAEDERKARLVMLRVFAGLDQAQAAEILGVTTRTIERDWKFTKAWLKRELLDPAHDEGHDEPG